MIIRHFDVTAPKLNPPQDEELEQIFCGHYMMRKCMSQKKRERDIQHDSAIRREGKVPETEFKRDCFLSILTDIKRNHVNMFELGAGWGRCCLELAGAIDYRVIPLIPRSYRCLAVEADSNHYQWAKEHFETQNINGIVVDGAVSNKNGVCQFIIDPDPASCYGQAVCLMIGSRKLPIIKNLYYNFIAKKTRTVSMYTVDHLIRAYGFDHIDILHMDVQGAEYKVMLGAAESIKNDLIDYLFIGTHSSKLNDMLKKLLCLKFNLIVDIYPRSISIVEGFPLIESHDGCQIYKRKNICSP